MSIVKREDTVSGGLGGKLPLPKGRYALQCVEEEFKASQNSGSMMIVRTWQLIDPNIVTTRGQSVVVAGIEFQQYVTTLVKNKEYTPENGQPQWDEERSKKAQANMFKDFELLGIDVSEGVDVENPPLLAKGKVIDAICDSEEYKVCGDPTPEQVAKGQRMGDPILDGDGKEITGYKTRMGMILGLSRVEPKQLD